MKRAQIVLTALVGAAPLACGMLAAICALPTALEIGFDLNLLILFCVVSSLLLSFWMVLPKYGFGFGALFLAGVILLTVFQSERIGDGAESFFNGLMKMLPEWISGKLDMEVLGAQADAVEHPELCVSILLMIIGSGLGVLLAYALLHCKVIALPLLIEMPPVMFSFLYTNHPPALWTVILMTVYCGYALLGNGFKREKPPERGTFLAALAPALATLCLLICAFFPWKTYVPIPEETRYKVFSDLFGDIGDAVLRNVGHTSPKEILLDTVRERERDPSVMFSISASRDGDYHLRVHSYGAYGTDRWREAPPYNGGWRSMEALGNRQPGTDATLEIKSSMTDERIIPYAFAADGTVVEESFVKAKGLTEYTWRFTRDYSIEPQRITDAEEAYYRFAAEQYTMPDGNPEKQWFRTFAETEYGIVPPESTDVRSVYETAWNVASHVRADARYEISPAAHPDGESFILFFLTESHEGYCVHFASATTAILQSLGIPARYTSGYYVSGVSESWTNVTANDKHAWTEIYLRGVGWVPLESTPNKPESPSVDELLPLINEQEGPSAEYPPEHEVPTPVIVPPTPGIPEGTVTTVPEPEPEPVPEPEPSVPAIEKPGQGPESRGEPTVSDKPAARETPREAQSKRKGAWWLLLLIPVLPAIWAGIGIMVRKRREARFRDPDVRRAIPEMAYYLERLQRFGIPADPEADGWATEAAFSDHSMKREQKELLKRVRAAQETLTQGKPLRRFLFRWILFVA